ncbi:MAG: putative zinc-binding protein [Phycisphaeraceae bacterium]|nr:putative zinc-binding protein [Phycisphaeraceae bacterium]
MGEIADRAARRLMAEGFGSMSCLAGLGGDDEGMIRAMKDADENVVIDGCSKDCARSVMQRVGAAKFRHLHITDLGIKKVKGVWATEAQVQAVVDAVKADGVM